MAATGGKRPGAGRPKKSTSLVVAQAKASLPALAKVEITPNPPLNSDPACIAFRSLSTSRYLGFVQRFGAGGAG